QLHGATVNIEFRDGTPAVINTPACAALARQAAVQVLGAEQVVDMQVANMGGEDFSYYLEQVPGCYVRFGSQLAGSESYPAHSSKFNFDEDALAVGAAYFARLARLAGERLLAKEGKS